MRGRGQVHQTSAHGGRDLAGNPAREDRARERSQGPRVLARGRASGLGLGGFGHDLFARVAHALGQELDQPERELGVLAHQHVEQRNVEREDAGVAFRFGAHRRRASQDGGRLAEHVARTEQVRSLALGHVHQHVSAAHHVENARAGAALHDGLSLRETLLDVFGFHRRSGLTQTGPSRANRPAARVALSYLPACRASTARSSARSWKPDASRSSTCPSGPSTT